MKLYIAAAGALLLGTSAFAFAPGMDVEKTWSKDDQLTAEKTGHQLKLSTADVIAGAKAQSTTASWSKDEATLVDASAQSWQDSEPVAGRDPDLDLAETPADMPSEPVAEETAEAETATPVEIASADISPRPAANNYPACDPGPGDDSCIQLYEPGVRVALASWNKPTGGLAQPGDVMMASAEADDATGVGGPYEPVDGTAETAMNGDGLIEGEAGETDEVEAL